jgi:hypothetical protein
MILFIGGFTLWAKLEQGCIFLKEKQRVNGRERVKLRTLPYFQLSNFNLEVAHPITHCIKEVLSRT